MSAKIHLSVNLMGQQIQGLIGATIGVQITSLSEEHHYFNRPMFEASNNGLGGVPTFAMVEMLQNEAFPVKLERGEQISVDFRLVKESLMMWESFPAGTTFHAVVSTTEGVTYTSNNVDVANVIALLNRL